MHQLNSPKKDQKSILQYRQKRHFKEFQGGNCGCQSFNSQLPLVGLLPIQQGMPLGMPMALISTGGGQGGCFPAAYLMAQDRKRSEVPYGS